MTLIAIESLLGAGMDDVMVGLNPPGPTRVPGLLERLREYFAPRPVTVINSGFLDNDPFLEMTYWTHKHLKASMDTETKGLLSLSARSHMFRHCMRSGRNNVYIIKDQLFSNVAGSRTQYPEIQVPTPQGVMKLPGYFFANSLNRYSMNHCVPDLIISYEPSLQAIATATHEQIEKIQLAFNCYVAVRDLLVVELGEKCKIAPLTSPSPTLPPTVEVIEAMFNTIVRGVEK